MKNYLNISWLLLWWLTLDHWWIWSIDSNIFGFPEDRRFQCLANCLIHAHWIRVIWFVGPKLNWVRHCCTEWYNSEVYEHVFCSMLRQQRSIVLVCVPSTSKKCAPTSCRFFILCTIYARLCSWNCPALVTLWPTLSSRIRSCFICHSTVTWHWLSI